MLVIPLDGTWQLSDTQGSTQVEGQIPGCVHTDLLRAGLIPDPWYRDNEKDIHWLCLRDWTYERCVHIAADFLQAEELRLQCDGLDTLCDISINDQPVLFADNMFRSWEADIQSVLRPGENRIRLSFRSPIPLMKERDAKLRLHAWNIFHEDFVGKSYVRKMACSFGWDWGFMAVSQGAWLPLRLIAYEARILHLHIHQQHLAHAVCLYLQAEIEGQGQLRYCLCKDQEEAEEWVSAENGCASISIQDPALWWPQGMGEQPLYTLHSQLLSADGRLLDHREQRIGLRSIRLLREPDHHGECFAFVVNGRRIFIKGANWIPCDAFPSRIQEKQLRHLLTSAAECGMNMLRVWGGGIYELESFYDLCDELGILVWQDFMFACSTYPSFDQEWMDSVAAEASYQVRRLHHRACLALWCGNNEIEQGLVKWRCDGWDDRQMPADDYQRLFDQLLPRIVEEEDGSTPYWPSSSHTPGEHRANCMDHRRGDAHAWSVWFGGQTIESQRLWKFRFMSEFGFQSFPEPRSVESFTAPEDRSLGNWVMDYHQRSGPGNRTIFSCLLDWFQPPCDFANSLWMSQIIQALCIQYAAEHARRIQGQMDGILFWQLNDLWPGATWSSIDVFGRWKALQYFARRFFAPVLVSLVEDACKHSVEIHLSNHRPDNFSGSIEWRVTDMAGQLLDSGVLSTVLPSQTNHCVCTLDLREYRERKGLIRLPASTKKLDERPLLADRDLLVWAVCKEGGEERSRNIGFFAKPKYWLLSDPSIHSRIYEQAGELYIHLEASACAPWTRLEVQGYDALFSDNFFHLAPGLPLDIRVSGPEINLDVLRKHLIVTSLTQACGLGFVVQS